MTSSKFERESMQQLPQCSEQLPECPVEQSLPARTPEIARADSPRGECAPQKFRVLHFSVIGRLKLASKRLLPQAQPLNGGRSKLLTSLDFV